MGYSNSKEISEQMKDFQEYAENSLSPKEKKIQSFQSSTSIESLPTMNSISSISPIKDFKEDSLFSSGFKTSCETIVSNYNENPDLSPFHSSEELRKNYINQLFTSYKENNQKTKVKKCSATHNNIFIFDWDDTLLCTSYLGKDCIYSDSSLTKRQLQSLHTLG